MKKVEHDIYNRIDNDLYNAEGDIWWQPDSPLYLMKCSVNPARVGYFKKILNELNVDPQGKPQCSIPGIAWLPPKKGRGGFNLQRSW